MRNATLCIPIKENKLLLGVKKKGFGKDKLNGFGGKVNPEETIEAAAARELFEEVGLKVNQRDLKKVAELDFYFPVKKEWNQTVHVFIVENWQDNPAESDEMSFEWISKDNIPFSKMWDDDKYWLPLILEGKKIKADFYFGEDNNTIINKDIIELK